MRRLLLVLVMVCAVCCAGCDMLAMVSQFASTAAPEITAAPTPQLTAVPTPEPTGTPEPTPEPTATLEPTPEPTIVPTPEPTPIAPGLVYWLEVDVTNQVTIAYQQDADGQYTIPVRYMICSTGTKKTPTPLGTFAMPGSRGRWGYFEQFKVYAQYFTRIKGSILFHSVLYAKQDERTLSTASVRNLGKRASHGCIRLTVPDAQWIFDNCPEGTVVTVLEKDADEAVVALARDAAFPSATPEPTIDPNDPFATPIPTPFAGTMALLSSDEVVMTLSDTNQHVLFEVTTPDNITLTNPAMLQWYSADPGVCEVVSGTGQLLPRTLGSTIITVTYPGVQSFNIRVMVTQ